MVVAYLSKKTLSAWLAIFYLIPFISKHCLRLRFGSDKCDCELLSFRPIQRINRRRWLPSSSHTSTLLYFPLPESQRTCLSDYQSRFINANQHSRWSLLVFGEPLVIPGCNVDPSWSAQSAIDSIDWVMVCIFRPDTEVTGQTCGFCIEQNTKRVNSPRCRESLFWRSRLTMLDHNIDANNAKFKIEIPLRSRSSDRFPRCVCYFNEIEAVRGFV